MRSGAFTANQVISWRDVTRPFLSVERRLRRTRADENDTSQDGLTAYPTGAVEPAPTRRDRRPHGLPKSRPFKKCRLTAQRQGR
jgi:hypothetical protein